MKAAKFEKAVKALCNVETFNKTQVEEVISLLLLCATKDGEKHYVFDDESVIYIEEKQEDTFIVLDLSVFFP